MAEITSSYSVVDCDNEIAFPQASKQETKPPIAPDEDQSSCLNASPDEILELLKGDHSGRAPTTKLAEESGTINVKVEEAPSEDRMRSSTMVYSFIGDPGASFLENADTKERDWVSIPAPAKPEDHATASVYDQAKTPENTEWISVDVPGHQKQSDDTCSVPCSLVEWITVDMPSKAGQGDASIKRGMEFSEHVCASFSEKDERAHHSSTSQKYYSAASSQAYGIGPVPRTRKRRTISGKIRARIEAFENSFRQELDRLNSPLTKVKNRRIHEGLRRGAAAAVSIDEGPVANFKDVQQRLKRLSLCEEKPPRPNAQLRRLESQVGKLPSQVPETVTSECQSSQANSEEFSKFSETVHEDKNVPEHMFPELNSGAEPGEEPVKPDTFEDEEWELAGNNGAESLQADQEKKFELEGIDPVDLTRVPDECKCKNQTSVGGLVKQVISGAALLAGLIFLWPRGNNLIWRCGAPQKRKRYNVVTKASSCQEFASYSDSQKPSGSRFNLECFKG